MKVGVLKPDHLGDLVLSAPAVAVLRRRFADLTLFCHPKSLALAAHLFPGLPARPVLLPHLDKDRGLPAESPSRLRQALAAVDLLICLRWDGIIEQLVRGSDMEFRTLGPVSLGTHVAAEHRAVVQPYTGTYDILNAYRYPFSDACPVRPRQVGAIGLCVSAGFHLNAWPLSHWLDLARLLHKRGMEVVLLGGPDERCRLTILAAAIVDALGYTPRAIIGSSDFGESLSATAAAVDLVVATDSGTAHLASLVRPVISLFGGSPWRRFAPLGWQNVILTRHYPCSPCWQFLRKAVNTCHTQECLTNLFPERVAACLDAYLAGVEVAAGVELDGVWMMQAPWNEPVTMAA